MESAIKMNLRHDYIVNGLSCKELSKKYDVNLRQLYRMSKEWEAEREKRLKSLEEISEEFVTEMYLTGVRHQSEIAVKLVIFLKEEIDKIQEMNISQINEYATALSKIVSLHRNILPQGSGQSVDEYVKAIEWAKKEVNKLKAL